jgi:hypothetical protein
MIKLLHILDIVLFGGLERRRLSLAEQLDRTKFELKIICTNALGFIVDEFQNKKQGLPCLC